jgi:hypothetical protein
MLNGNYRSIHLELIIQHILTTLIFSILLLLQPDYCPLQASPLVHDYKMSVTEVIYQPATASFEVKFYLFSDDITATLTGNPASVLPGRDAINTYILQHFELKVNGTKQALDFFSIRNKEDQVLVQFNTPAFAGNIANIAVRNTLMTDKFQEQTNVVYAIVPGKNKKTEMLDGKRSEGYFSY